MHRHLLSAATVAALVVACSTPFGKKRTPSGEFCSDMQVVPAGQAPDREYHRLQPIASDPEVRTEAERLESLRKAACAVGGDAVIEAVNEEVRTEDGRYASVASGTAVVWVRPTGMDGATPLNLRTPAASASAEAAPASSEAAPASSAPDLYEEAAPAASAKPTGSAKPASSAKPAGSSKPSAPPFGAPKPASSAPSSSPKPPSSPTPPKVTPLKPGDKK